MPGQFLSKAEREQLSTFPSSPTEDDIITFFTLSITEKKLISQCSTDYNQLGFALQLGTLGYLGFVPDELTSAPKIITEYLANQIKVNPNCLSLYGKRDKTRTNHLLKIQAHLGWRKATNLDFLLWQNWLLDRAMEHDRPSLLFQLLCEKLLTEKIVRPGVTILERMVITARSHATIETFNRLQFLLTSSTKAFLDSLLIADKITGRTPLTWLGRSETSNSPNAILNALSKLTFLAEYQVQLWDLSCLNPNRIKFLAQLGKKSSNQALQRANDDKRYPILVAFVYQIFEEVTDETMDLYIHCLGDIDARARRDLKEFHLREAKATNEKVRLLKELGKIILDEAIKNEEVRGEIFQNISPEALRAAIEDCKRLMRPLDDNHFDFLANRYGYLRRFAPVFFGVFSFSSNLADDPLLKALSLLRELDGEKRLQQQQEILDYQLEKLHQTIQDNEQVRMDANDELIISPLKAEDLPVSAQNLQQLIGKGLPQIDLSELLMEMDKLTGFSYALTHAGGNNSRSPETQKYLYAAILAQATNLGLSRMATIANLSYDRLVWFTNWYLREDTLKEANNALVNFQYHQWKASILGWWDAFFFGWSKVSSCGQ
jgi:hypothetical protein